MKRVLFFCTRNSARSQMAEAWLKRLGGASFEVESAGLEAGTLKPSVIAAMREVDIDLSTKTTQTVLEVFNSGRPFDYVIALCDQEKADRCPTFPGAAKRLHWSVPERPTNAATEDDKLEHARTVRELIRRLVKQWLAEHS